MMTFKPAQQAPDDTEAKHIGVWCTREYAGRLDVLAKKAKITRAQIVKQMLDYALGSMEKPND